MYNEEDILVLNNKDYLIVKKLQYKEHFYYYLIGVKNKNLAIVKEIKENEDVILKSIEDENEEEIIMNMFSKDILEN